MFYGEYQHTLDLKGRIIIPAKFRDELGDNFIIAKGLDGCLSLYPVSEWSNIVENLNILPTTDKDIRAFKRFLFSGASECEIDKQGRILIPCNLREYANLEKELCIVGMSTKIEIWDKKKWDSCNEDFNSPENLAEKMSILGI